MFKLQKNDKLFFKEKGYIIKNDLVNNKKFIELAIKFKQELFKVENFFLLSELGGYKSGNLNIDPGKFGSDFLNLLYKFNFDKLLSEIISEDIRKYDIHFGGNLNLNNSKKQIFHTDGKWDPRMLVVNIATTDITNLNGPTELLEKSHKNEIPYWKFVLKKKSFNSVKATMKVGEILIREHRLWHRGTENRSNIPREMIGIMFIKKNFLFKKTVNKHKKNIKIFSNMYGLTKKEKIKEFIFLFFPILLIIFKILISIRKK